MLTKSVLNSAHKTATEQTQKMAPHLWVMHVGFFIFFNSLTAISWYLQGNSIYAIKQQPVLLFNTSEMLKCQKCLRNIF